MSTITPEAKEIIEGNPVAIATVTPEGKPNVIGVAYVKVVNDSQILVTDNYMNQTLEDIENSPNVAVLGWNKKMDGYKLLGTAEYFTSGEWIDRIKSMPENKNMPAKGALLITVSKIIKSS